MKICSICNNNLEYNLFHKKPSARTPDGYSSACIVCSRKRQKELRDKRKANGQCVNCTRARDNKTTCCNSCIKRAKDNRFKLKTAVYNAYGGSFCRCCGESEVEFLSIDHINNNGAEHRRSINTGAERAYGGKIYTWLKKNGYPEGFQVLCMNCNFSKGRYGYCPHQKLSKMR